MKKVTTKLTSKTPSTASMTHSVTTTRMQKPKGQQQQQRQVTSVSSKTSVTAVVLPGGQQRTRTEESVTTKIQMPIAQAASNWQSGLRSTGMQQPRQSYAAQQQQRQLQAEQEAQAQRQSAIPRMQMPQNIPQEIANVAQAQYGQLMDSPEPPPPPQQKRMMQAPQFGGGQRQQQMPPPQQQQRQRQMQQPQQYGGGQRQQQMPPPQQQQQQQPQQQQRQMQQPQQQQRQMQQPQQYGGGQRQQQMPPPQQQQMPPPQQQQRQRQMQQPQVGGGQRQQSAMPPPQQQQRQMQQPQGVGGQRRQMSAIPPPQQQQQRQRQGQQPGGQSRMQQPRSRTGMVQPKQVVATAVPTNMIQQDDRRTPPRPAPPSPGTMEFEMFEGFSPETIKEYEAFEDAPAARPRTQLQPQNRLHGQPKFASPSPPRPTISSAADQQYKDLMSPGSPSKGPCGPATCGFITPPQQQQQRPRRQMQQPGFMANIPQQAVSAAAQQYASLMDSPEQRGPSPRQKSPREGPLDLQSKEYDMVADISIPTAASGQPTALERDVEIALMNTSHSKPGTRLRADGQIQRLATPQESPGSGVSMVQTPTGLLPAETQLLLEGSVRRTPTEEIVTRHVLAVEGGMVDERETVYLSPGKGIRKPKTPESMELIVCSSEVKMAGGYRETTTRVVYETTDEPPTSSPPKLPAEVTPNIVSQLVLEESADVDKATKLHAPDLKHSSPLTYGIKKRVNALQLNMLDVQELEETVTWPPPRADQAQEDPHPELLASMMMTEEKGLTMGSTPDQLYSALFGAQEPVKTEEGTVEVNSVATHPLNDVVVPSVAASRELHLASLTPELVNAAVSAHTAIANSDDTETVQPSDGAYAERVLGDKKDAMEHVKVRNVGHRDGPPVKYPVFFDADKAAPWEVDKFDAVIKQVGAIPTSVLEASVVGPSAADAAEELRDFSADGIEYLLNMDEITHQSNVQLRGTKAPSWFPGYFMALGGSYGTDNVTIARSPSQVLAAAYRAVQPDTFNDDSIVAV